jgi:hypothetical protein
MAPTRPHASVRSVSALLLALARMGCQPYSTKFRSKHAEHSTVTFTAKPLLATTLLGDN